MGSTSSTSMIPLNFSSVPSNPLINSPPIPKKLISKWEIEGKMISLFHESTLNRFECTDERTGRNATFKPTLYDIRYAVSLISMFQKTIGVNLERGELNSACFLPKLCIEANREPGIQVALFGFCDTRNNPEGEVKWLRWGVFHHATKEEQTFECNGARTFLQNAPTTNRPDMRPKVDEKGQPVLDKTGKQILEEGPNHYAMTAYSQRFSVRLTRNAGDHHIEKVALHYISLLDENVLLDRNNWAVTLVSALRSSPTNRFFRWLEGEDTGHAMLACEGVEEGKPFLRYVHLTQEPRDKNPELKEDEAQIEWFDRKTPLVTFNGPTWLRSNDLVKNMFSYVQALKNQRIKFAPYGNFFSLNRWDWIVFKNRFLNVTDSHSALNQLVLSASQQSSPETCSPATCLFAAYAIAVTAGIIFQADDSVLRKPIEKINTIRSAPILLIPKDFDDTCLGRPLGERYKILREQILSACVILTDKDCSPDNCAKWLEQTTIEELAERDRVMARIEASQSLGDLFADIQYKPKRW